MGFKIPRIPNISVGNLKMPTAEINKATAQLNKAGGLNIPKGGSVSIDGKLKKTAKDLSTLKTVVETGKNVAADVKSGDLNIDSVSNDVQNAIKNGDDVNSIMNGYKDKYTKGE